MMSPEDLLGVVAMGLLAGLRGARASRLAVLALPAGWLASGDGRLGIANWGHSDIFHGGDRQHKVGG